MCLPSGEMAGLPTLSISKNVSLSRNRGACAAGRETVASTANTVRMQASRRVITTSSRCFLIPESGIGQLGKSDNLVIGLVDQPIVRLNWSIDRCANQITRLPDYPITAMPRLSRREFTLSVLGAAAASRVVSATVPGLQAPATQAGRAAGTGDTLAGLTLSEAATRIKAGTVTSTDLVNACLKRIEIYNPKINAFITVTRE